MDTVASFAHASGAGQPIMSPEQADRLMIEVEKGQQVAGHFPSAVALDRARRVLDGTITPEQALREITARFA
ncbi:MAG: hypothetical protein QM621_01010 [Aeromicrobium sp.]|uniref:hypothetical protein n=1 Tax=Aeromicrobium sp. TaxID=1871063 RepID=UPI0039E5A1F0